MKIRHKFKKLPEIGGKVERLPIKKFTILAQHNPKDLGDGGGRSLFGLLTFANYSHQ